MVSRYRFTLGYKRVSANLLTGVPKNLFVIGSASYNLWAWSDVVMQGRKYEVAYEQIGGSSLGVAVGFGEVGPPTTGFISRWHPSDNGNYIYRNVCLEGTKLLIAAQNDSARGTINEELYELDWNDPLNTIPVGWDEAKINLKRDEADRAQIETYSSDLIFLADGWDYLREIELTEGRGAAVPIKIEKLVDWCSPYASNLIYETLYEGVIYLNKATWDYPHRSIKVAIEDSSPSAILANGKDINIEMNWSQPAVNLIAHQFYFIGDNYYTVRLHDNAGSYPITQYNELWRVYSGFKNIIRGMSEGQVDVRSDFFDSGAYKWQMWTRGDKFYQGMPIVFSSDFSDTPMAVNFTDFFNKMDRIFNLGIGFGVENNIPVIRIEPKSYFKQTSSIVEISNVKEISITAPKEINYRTLDIGYKNIWDSAKETNNDNGWEIHYSSGKVTDGVKLDLVADVIAEQGYIYYAIQQGLSGETADIDDKLILVECFESAGVIKSTQVTGGEYNHTIHPEDNFARWKPSLPQEFFVGGLAESGEGDEFRNKLIKFSTPLTMKDFNKLVNPTAKIRLINPAKNKALIDGIAMSVSRSMKTGIAEIEILTS